VFAVVGAACFAFALLLTSIFLCAFDRAFYQSAYEKLGVAADAGLSESDLMLATDALLDYCSGKRADLNVVAVVSGEQRPVFVEREIAHMADVRTLALAAKKVQIGLFVAFAAFLAVALKLKPRGQNLYKPLLVGLVAGIALMAAVGVYAAVDFDAFWTRFHLLLFTNDLWLLDPMDSVLINMVPQAFFFSLVMRILTFFSAGMLAFAAACIAGMAIHRRRRKRELVQP
jgi:integral membrane protein (TIGR01906 family)